ncbi:hypothetical protein L0668_06525 [Paraglaciecola aquimarina]|uniref:Transglutaminase-like domain-containing protein n=1 Tax=Paraglaciecola algarum TaxID=3050085 RepID=A0ABS9D6U0_9ALTE|nr:hypothetical protein [Paraglaciecola sp. G1-23]MCF2947753.1 hypothetical protein [Paraglaciecola sp. G1-23]
MNSFDNEYLRFKNDQPAPFETIKSEISRKENESETVYAQRVTIVVSKGLSHIEWFDYPETRFNQLIPVWENYFLYFMGKYSGIPEYERYHYANYERSLRRGIGICGDASMTLSLILDEHNIQNEILTFPGHVVVLAKFDTGEEYILDADFGVIVPVPADGLSINSENIANLYVDAGYKPYDFIFFNNMYKQDYLKWDGVKHFITNKYYFEMISYWLKWPLPIFMILFSLWALRQNKNKSLT